MPFSLSIYLYKSFQENFQKKFEKNNTILTPEKIENLLLNYDKTKTIQIFKSAVVDHKAVEGQSYYLMSPIAPLFYHDYFKRFFIAEGLGKMAEELKDYDGRDVLCVLDALIDLSNVGYVQIVGWNALARWAVLDPKVFLNRQEDLVKAFGGSSASLLGVLLFLEHILLSGQKEDGLEFIKLYEDKVRYRVQKAMFAYFLVRHKNMIDPRLLSKHISDKNNREFLEKCQEGQFTCGSFYEHGFREMNLIVCKQRLEGFSETEQDRVVRKLKKICGDYLQAMDMFLKLYW